MTAKRRTNWICFASSAFFCGGGGWWCVCAMVWVTHGTFQSKFVDPYWFGVDILYNHKVKRIHRLCLVAWVVDRLREFTAQMPLIAALWRLLSIKQRTTRIDSIFIKCPELEMVRMKTCVFLCKISHKNTLLRVFRHKNAIWTSKFCVWQQHQTTHQQIVMNVFFLDCFASVFRSGSVFALPLSFA